MIDPEKFDLGLWRSITTLSPSDLGATNKTQQVTPLVHLVRRPGKVQSQSRTLCLFLPFGSHSVLSGRSEVEGNQLPGQLTTISKPFGTDE